MQKDRVTGKLIDKLSITFKDFNGLYFYGSRVTKTNRIDSDYDYVLIFGTMSYDKELKIAGIVSLIEYEEQASIDYRIFTDTGIRSIEYIRKQVNPVFIHKAVDNGIYYGRK